VPQSYSLSIDNIKGLGLAFTAKYSRNPLFQENAFLTDSAFALVPFASYM
jgi:hypothetical protein